MLFFPFVKRGGVFGSRLRFWVRRGARLLPAYWLVLALCLVLLAVVPPEPGPGFPSLCSIAGHFTATHQPALLVAHADFAPGFGLAGAVWMISVVVAFYAVLPFIAGPFYRRPILALLTAAALTLAWKEAVMQFPQFWIDLSGGFPYARGLGRFVEVPARRRIEAAFARRTQDAPPSEGPLSAVVPRPGG